MDNERILSIILLGLVWMGFAVFLVKKEDGLPSAIIQTLFLFYWSYMGHVYAHHASLEYPFNILNTHVSIHHSKVDHVPRWLELTIESFSNFMGFFVIYIAQMITGVKIINLKLILYSAFLYIGIHIFYYSVFTDSKYHQVHHDDPFHNYSPELFDIIFNTRKYDKEYDKISIIHEVIPALISYYLVIYIFKFFKGIRKI
tara:strand:- start:2452 stop:3051 length:600 start_codon:yes stop_codon:yes gene_type:complete